MGKKSAIFSCLIVCFTLFSCVKETVENRDKLIIGTWDCVDYADSTSKKFFGEPPAFISHLNEKGYQFKKGNSLWTRNKTVLDNMFTDKTVECEWVLMYDNSQLFIVFPDNITEKYDILELTRKSLILQGREGLWASNKRTYVFEKQ